jgi:hypothetical protein
MTSAIGHQHIAPQQINKQSKTSLKLMMYVRKRHQNLLTGRGVTATAFFRMGWILGLRRSLAL